MNSLRPPTAASNTTQMAGRLGEILQNILERQKSVAADALAHLAQATREAAIGTGNEAPQTAVLMRVSADAADRAGAMLRDQSLDAVLGGVGGFARRQPVAFFGCGVVAGLVIARLFAAQKD